MKKVLAMLAGATLLFSPFAFATEKAKEVNATKQKVEKVETANATKADKKPAKKKECKRGNQTQQNATKGVTAPKSDNKTQNATPQQTPQLTPKRKKVEGC